MPFSGHIAKKFQTPTILPLNNASKMNFFPYLALQFEVLVILLQETHSTNAEKLVLPSFQLAWSFLSRKHGLATFVQERITYNKQGMLLVQSPPTSEIKWLCVDVIDGYEIFNGSLDLPMFRQPCFCAGNFNCRHVDWGYNDNNPDGKYFVDWASINSLALLYNAKDAANFCSRR